MTDSDGPDATTMLAATEMARAAIQAYALNVTSYLVDRPSAAAEAASAGVAPPDYAGLAGAFLRTAIETVGMDLPGEIDPADYDADLAREIALDMVARFAELAAMAARPGR